MTNKFEQLVQLVVQNVEYTRHSNVYIFIQIQEFVYNYMLPLHIYNVLSFSNFAAVLMTQLNWGGDQTTSFRVQQTLSLTICLHNFWVHTREHNYK